MISIYQCSCDIRVDMDTAQQTKGQSKMASFDFHEPAGAYELNLGTPADYALACEILFIANTRRKVVPVTSWWELPGRKFIRHHITQI